MRIQIILSTLGLAATVTAAPKGLLSTELPVPTGSVASIGACVSDTRTAVTISGVKKEIYTHCDTGSRIEMVKNSGICETTAGVDTYSGYISLGPDRDVNMYFWYFEARNNPDQAPLGVWLNGGPGCSSMMGLFKENGPCQFYNGSNEPSTNPYSWNNNVNMLYMDQPVGTGFSFSKTGKLVNSSAEAAPYFYQALQTFFARFPEMRAKDLGLFSQSYGGHYGPAFARYIINQNKALDADEADQKINLSVLGINDGWYDMKTHVVSYIHYAYKNKYRPLFNRTVGDAYWLEFNQECGPMLDTCQRTGLNEDCKSADSTCWDFVTKVIGDADFDLYDIRAPSNNTNPPKTYIQYLNRPAIKNAIGAKVIYEECSEKVYAPFDATGEEARSSIPDMSFVVNSGLPTIMWHGDADFDCNFLAGMNVARNLTWSGRAAFNKKTYTPFKLNGQEVGTFKTSDNLSFLKVNGAGHELPFYQPQIALNIFEQMMNTKTIVQS